MPKKKLVDGFNRFRAKYYEGGARLMEKLAREGAHPDFFIINCIDPRTGADLVFDAEPGQQFVRSQMAAIIPPYDAKKRPEISASLSYAIDTKKVEHLIVMGHSQCGGVAALVDGTSDQYIESWVKLAMQAKHAAAANTDIDHKDKAAVLRETERQVVIMSFKNLMEYPMVKKAVQEGRLTVDGWFFDLEKGTLHEYKPATNEFKQLNTVEPPPAAVVKKPPHRPPPPGMAA